MPHRIITGTCMLLDGYKFNQLHNDGNNNSCLFYGHWSITINVFYIIYNTMETKWQPCRGVTLTHVHAKTFLEA